MNATVITLIIIGIVAIIVSCVMTSDSTGEGEGSTEEKANPNLKTDLTEADKKQLRKITDNYINEYSKKKIKETISNSINSVIDDEVKKSDKIVSDKVAASIEKSVSQVDERATENTKKLETYYNEVSGDIEKSKAEVQKIYNNVVEKEKDIKSSLKVIDEYKAGLDKMKSQVADLQDIRQEITDLNATLDTKKNEIEELSATLDTKKAEIEEILTTERATRDAAVQAAAEGTLEATENNEVSDDTVELPVIIDDMLEQADEATASETQADEVTVSETVEDMDEAFTENEPVEEPTGVEVKDQTEVLAVAEDEVHPYEAVEEEADDRKSKKKKNKKNKKNKKTKQEEIQEEIPEEVQEDSDDVEDLLPIGEPVNSDDLYDDFDDDELEGLTGAENLDDILDREGIDISD